MGFYVSISIFNIRFSHNLKSFVLRAMKIFKWYLLLIVYFGHLSVAGKNYHCKHHP